MAAWSWPLARKGPPPTRAEGSPAHLRTYPPTRPATFTAARSCYMHIPLAAGSPPVHALFRAVDGATGHGSSDFIAVLLSHLLHQGGLLALDIENLLVRRPVNEAGRSIATRHVHRMHWLLLLLLLLLDPACRVNVTAGRVACALRLLNLVCNAHLIACQALLKRILLLLQERDFRCR